jgi:HAD superfamily hydrolase (TIGR01509 family)
MTGIDLPRPAGVVLDLDGTLVDTVETRIEAWLRTFAEEGIPADRAMVSDLIGSDGRHLARTVGEAGEAKIDDERAERIDARSGAIYSALNLNPRPLPGAVDLLDALDANGIAWAIGTSSRRDQVGPSVKALGRSRPVMIVDGTTVKRAKPHPDLLLAAAAALGADPAGCWCVGDSKWDMLAATASGMAGIGVLAGSAISADDLLDSGASLVLDSLADLVPRISPTGESLAPKRNIE